MFSEQDRKVFAFEDGTRDERGDPITVHADPLEIQSALSAALGGDVSGVIDRSEDFVRDPDGVPLDDGIRKAFGLEPLDRISGHGATAAMCLKVWNSFCAFMDAAKN